MFERLVALRTRIRAEEVTQLVPAVRAFGTIHNDDCFPRAWLFSELFPVIGFQIIKERIPVKIYRS